MERQELEVLTDVSNFAVVRMPGRNYPGSVVQGDSLSNLLSMAERAYIIAERIGNEDLLDQIGMLKDDLEDRLKHYEQVITAHGYSLPYFPPRNG